MSVGDMDDINHAGALLLDPLPYDQAQAACVAINEDLLPSQLSAQNTTDLGRQLRSQAYAGYVHGGKYWVQNGVLIATPGSENVAFHAASHNTTNQSLPVLCTQTQPGNDVGGFSPAPSTSIVTVESGDAYQGFRNKKAFWFAGIRYAQFPGRFSTAAGRQRTSDLSSSGFIVEASLAAKGLATVVNLRAARTSLLSPSTTGSALMDFWLCLADQITALDWVIANIEKFGGDPKRITIAGQSAGAGSARVMLGSPKAIGKFQGAVAMSNLGLDFALGLGSGYGTTYSSYYTVNESFSVAGQNIFNEAGCNQTSLAAQVACLTAYTGDLSSLVDVARYPVQDGEVINTEQLILTSRNDNTACVPIIFGVAEDDGASVGSYSKTCTTEAECLEQNLYISPYYSQDVIDSDLFPLYDTGNLTADSVNVSVRINTGLVWRCAGEATVYAGAESGAVPAAYFYESVRAYPEEAYNPLGLDITGDITPEYPLGNPNTFYYRVHSSGIPNFFGALHSYRDVNDLLTVQLTSGHFGSFIRTGQPNPDLAYLQVRGYQSTIDAIHESGPWPEPVVFGMHLDIKVT
ncbi:hypothetical protein INS49_005271 [Diaporthe citri]|uniref:uncharacterized protein n=1 Tax=Diaporthe citri TaxID=83186 RepID=UPI001C80D3F6|nr:uncharacterized protein INS49_005271 [Diaporthe citri]KAG6353790.1 hypothetical protein INS49_005271 [Diaporthe citri]